MQAAGFRVCCPVSYPPGSLSSHFAPCMQIKCQLSAVCTQELCYSPALLDLMNGHIVPSAALFCSTLQRDVPLQTQLAYQTITPITIPG